MTTCSTVKIGDRDAARELSLFAENDYVTYTQAIQPTISNLRRKIQRGTYDRQKALVAWVHVAEFAAKRYAALYSDSLSPWFRLFSVAVRKLSAEELAEFFSDEIEN